MNANEVNVVIDNICSKIGIAAGNAAEIIPEFARMKMLDNAIWAVCFFCLAALFFVIAYKYKDHSDTYPIFIFLAIVAMFIMFGYLSAAVRWGITPQAQMIEYVLSKLQN